jgi:hypothetical protein
MNMNVSEFERTKPTMTYQAINSAINKYQTLLEKYQFNGQQLIMESTDAQTVACYREFLNDLNNIKSLFIAGR